MELYVNVIELGRGIYGIEAGAQHHFGVSAARLTREQSALLAAVLPNPKGWNPAKPS
jgi:monofunctional biosynthetic peptidoglycan transglycosylase